MAEAKVYFTSFRTKLEESILMKFKRLLRTAGMNSIDFTDKFTAIKMHFGELGNMAYLRPNYARTVAGLVKEAGGKPFLTDCNTLYVGGRKNALDHLDTAYVNGFNPLTVGCHVIIADGLKGDDEAEVPFPEGEYIKTAKIGRAVMDADVFISLSHFKLHEMTGVGGAVKNIGMGCGSRAGKMDQHCSGKPNVAQELCIGCGACARICAHGAPVVSSRKCVIDHEKCVGCGRCISVCPKDAVQPVYHDSLELLSCRMAEYAAAVVKGRPQFHISLIVDVSPFCDCHAENDAPIIPDVGILASFDAVALDQACVDLMNKQPMLHGTIMDEREHTHDDWAKDVHPTTDWTVQLAHAEKMGMGTRQYELITVN